MNERLAGMIIIYQTFVVVRNYGGDRRQGVTGQKELYDLI